MTHVIFDVGRVLIEWDPRHLYRQLLPDEAAVEDFLTRICPPEWNAAQDLGRSWAEAVAEQSARHPDHAELIAAWDARWIETVPDAIWETVALLERLDAAGIPLYGLTNFSHEKWPQTVARYPFLGRFADVVVSGEVGMIKPDPAIYRHLLDRNGLRAEDGFFIDDSEKNVAAARALGLDAHHFTGPQALERDLVARGLL
ncbi:HAD family phosphatase [Rhodobacteraceae bacterium NNCM2]|nr:HAD family phosphatase [Coraliihabitans acroporae]